MRFSLSEPSVSTESAEDFYNIGQRQDGGMIDDPTTGGDMSTVGRIDRYRQGDTYFQPRDFGLKFVNKEDEDDDDEDTDDFDGDDDASEEELRGRLHTLYSLENTLRAYPGDPSVESLIARHGLVDMSAVTGGEDIGLEEYGLEPTYSSEDYLTATAYTISNIQNRIRDIQAGIY